MKNFPVPADFSAQARTAIDSENELGMMQETLLDRVFPLMCESKDPDVVVESILEMVGRWYDISRVGIFEEDAAGKGVENTYEWCNEGVSPHKAAKGYMSHEEAGGDYRSLFDERGIFCCSDVETLPDWARKILVHRRVKSVLQFIIFKSGDYKGFVSFDDCAVACIWTKSQIDTLVFIAKLLSSFLQKKKSSTGAAEE